jgi:hypothetical protein
MKGTVYKVAPGLLAVLALALLAAALWTAAGATPAQAAAGLANPETAELLKIAGAVPLAQKPDNDLCMACHGRPDQVQTFPNGDTISISVDPEVYAQSKHANLACTTCHTNISTYPHPENPANSAREYTLQYQNSCNQCHPGQAAETKDSAHANLPPEHQDNAPTCADCHDPHAQPDVVTDDQGDPVPAERGRIAEICSACHASIVEEFKQSVHGQALVEEANPDVPACNDCHGIHNIESSRTVEFRLNSPQLCAECHTREDIMSKYGISTDVMNTYVSDFHGSTVTLFSKERSGEDTNKPVCYDCHGVHNIMATDDPDKGLAVKENMLASCQRCHPDASENFSASWMSHYIASPTRYPLVYYVNLFYSIFIPAVLGGMGLFVLSDILYRTGVTRRRKKVEAAPPAQDQADNTPKE